MAVTDTILQPSYIRPSNGNIFSEVLGRIRTQVSPSDSRTSVNVLGKTRSGDVLLEVGSGTESKTNVVMFSCLPWARLSLFVLGSPKRLSSCASWTSLFPPRNFVSIDHSRWHKMAIVTLNSEHADALLAKRHLRVDQVGCKIHPKLVFPRCYK